ncbi:MAG: hypothetical protein NC299_11445 [Lachnospiraceae bacterium]|nr:hypothetical protein [Ruminococcus sp.]MCM1275959.1 hypothetical protein [Lachnospiraceae bacterium]
MNYKLKKKLIHFYTSGSVAEDFVASRRKKVSVMRRIIRACFYLHCAAALLCIGLSILLGSGIEVVLITLFTVGAAWLSLFAVGDSRAPKAALIAADLALAAAGFAVGAFAAHKAAFVSCGSIMLLACAAALVSYFTSLCKDYLEGYSPRLIRRDDYTLLPNFAPETSESMIPSRDEELPPLPPLTSEMRELARQLKDILCAVPEKEPEEEILEELTAPRGRETE